VVIKTTASNNVFVVSNFLFICYFGVYYSFRLQSYHYYLKE